jgi:PAS domain S-box-containing protein
MGDSPHPAGEHRAAQELREDSESFRLLVESVRDYAIFMLDPGGHIATWNEGARRIKGYTSAEILDQHFSIFYTPEDVSSGHPAQELVEAQRDGRYEEEGWRVRKDGSRFWANVLITPLRDASGELRGFAKVTRDMTDRRASEERLREAHAEIARRELNARHAAQINDDLVQALAVAYYAIEHGEAERAKQAVEDALDQAKALVADLLTDEQLVPSGLRKA